MGKKIAIIDEDKKSLKEVERVLAVCGHEPIAVCDALMAVDTVVRRMPDLILLELKMPRKSGFEIANEINYALETRKVPIIGMSSFFKSEPRVLFDLCGINRHLRKPLNPLDIIWAVENIPEKAFVQF